MVQNVLIIRNGEIFFDVEHLSYLATVMFLDPGNAIIWVIEEIVWIELGFGSTSFGFCKRIPCDFFLFIFVLFLIYRLKCINTQS